jgi:hypothetical protein
VATARPMPRALPAPVTTATRMPSPLLQGRGRGWEGGGRRLPTSVARETGAGHLPGAGSRCLRKPRLPPDVPQIKLASTPMSRGWLLARWPRAGCRVIRVTHALDPTSPMLVWVCFVRILSPLAALGPWARPVAALAAGRQVHLAYWAFRPLQHPAPPLLPTAHSLFPRPPAPPVENAGLLLPHCPGQGERRAKGVGGLDTALVGPRLPMGRPGRLAGSTACVRPPPRPCRPPSLPCAPSWPPVAASSAPPW